MIFSSNIFVVLSTYSLKNNDIYPQIITWYRIWYVNISWYVSNGHFGTWDKSFIFLDATWSHLETKHLTNSLQYMSCASYSLKCQICCISISSTFLWFSNTTFIYSFPLYFYKFCIKSRIDIKASFFQKHHITLNPKK